MLYQIDVSWTETGTIMMEADNLDSAIKKAKETLDDIDLPKGEYLDNSFQVDEETTRLINKIFNRQNRQAAEKHIIQSEYDDYFGSERSIWGKDGII